MKEFIRAFDGLPFIVKIILALPFADIVWSIYRLIKSIDEHNDLGIVLAIVLLFFGPFFWWIIDMIAIIATPNHTIWWF